MPDTPTAHLHRDPARSQRSIPTTVAGVRRRLAAAARRATCWAPTRTGWTGPRCASSTAWRSTFECNGATRRVELPTPACGPICGARSSRADVRALAQFDDYSEQFVSSYPVRTASAGCKRPTRPRDSSSRCRRPAATRSSTARFAAGASARSSSGYGMGWSQDNGADVARGSDRPVSGPSSGACGRQRRTGRRVCATRSARTACEDRRVRPRHPGFGTAQKELVERSASSTTSRRAPRSAATLRRRQGPRLPSGAERPERLPGAAAPARARLRHRAAAGLRRRRPAQRSPGSLSITAVDGHWNPDTITAVPSTSTAYMHLVTDAARLVAVAPRALLEPGRAWSTLGLLNLDPTRFGLMQVDVDGGLHKAVMLADSVTQLAGESLPRAPRGVRPDDDAGRRCGRAGSPCSPTRAPWSCSTPPRARRPSTRSTKARGHRPARSVRRGPHARLPARCLGWRHRQLALAAPQAHRARGRRAGASS